jgi:hypothetical protein
MYAIFTVGVVIGIILYRFFCDDPKLANNQTKSNLLKPSPAPARLFYMPRFLLSLKPDFSIIISTSTFDMIYYSKQKYRRHNRCYITKQRCSIENAVLRNVRTMGGPMNSVTPF